MFDSKSTRPSLLTLQSDNDDAKRKGLVRLMQRGLLDEPTTSAGLRRAVEDKFKGVRQTAFLISVLSRPKLAELLRSKDKDLDRKLKELESFEFESDSSLLTKPKANKRSVKRQAKKKAVKRKAGE